MRLFNIVLLVILLFSAYRLWFGHNGVKDYQKYQGDVNKLVESNQELQKRNELLAADVADLTIGTEGIEERARNELGLIKEGETFFRIIPPEGRY
ncbi:cell division protein FtsB [Flocculibacter collagenilyticus]|uniref:cell division protein FtsB n=1 Tax=Flocculibacter collagenilyticus TaxID=2744479 RepID=UPI0018F585B9|nr:cell division protein FtsB [Flocculibacter collagenilyticus]